MRRTIIELELLRVILWKITNFSTSRRVLLRSALNKLRNIFTSIGLNTFKRVYKSRSSFSRFLNKSIDENKLNIAN